MISILLADDETTLVNILAPWVRERFNGVVEVAYDGREAFEKLNIQPFDLLITDIVMPHMNGVELIRKARGIFKGMPVIAMSGYYFSNIHDTGTDIAQLHMLFESGKMAFLAKPFRLSAMETIVIDLLKSKVDAGT